MRGRHAARTRLGIACVLPRRVLGSHVARAVLVVTAMGRAERRACGRIACGSAEVNVTSRDGRRGAMLADVSRRGLRLVGRDLPAPSSPVLLELEAPSGVVTRGHVTWRTDTHDAIGVEIPKSATASDLASAMLAIAFERQSARPAAAILTLDPVLAARLCQPLRSEGFVPRWAATPLEAIELFEGRRPVTGLAIVGPGALGLPHEQALSFLADEYPQIRTVVLDHDGPDAPGRLVTALRRSSRRGP